MGSTVPLDLLWGGDETTALIHFMARTLALYSGDMRSALYLSIL